VTGLGLHARTVPLEYGPDALQFNGSPTVLFDRPGLTLVGWGTAQLVGAAQAAEVLASIPCDDAVGRPGTGVVALGALPFLDALSGTLIVPRFLMGIARDADGQTHRWATAVGPDDSPLPDTDALFDAVIWQYGTGSGATAPEDSTASEDGTASTEPAPAEVELRELTSPLPTEGYRQVVAGAVALMRQPGAALRKVVLSRRVTATLSGPLALSVVLRRLRSHEPTCTIFSLPVPEGTFFGATPELLIARHGERITCHPLAGTVRRGDTARSDADAQGQLAASVKDHDEHRYVVEAIATQLAPFCRELRVPAEPSLVAFRSVAHLGTRMEGELASPVPVLDLVAQLHPTPAVGGTPRDLALETIARSEPVPRDYWAGPVGWVDAAGNGEWMVGIRSARLHPDAESVTLQAGSGVVADSDPAAEAAETNIKLATVLESVVPGGAADLG
jgi:isochorismate synthase